MPGLIHFVLASLWHGLLFAIAVLVAALAGKAGGAPIAEILQIHESIPTAGIFFGVLGLGGWLYSRFGPKGIRTIVYPYIWP
jgi:hypothetical protein